MNETTEEFLKKKRFCPLCKLEKEGNLYVPFGFICNDCDKICKAYNDRINMIRKMRSRSAKGKSFKMPKEFGEKKK